MHGSVSFSLLFEIRVASFLRIFSNTNRATNAIQAKTSRIITKASTELLQLFLCSLLALCMMWTSELFTVPSRCISSCFVKRYRESVIVFSNCRFKCYCDSIPEIYRFSGGEATFSSNKQCILERTPQQNRSKMIGKLYLAAENDLISPFIEIANLLFAYYLPHALFVASQQKWLNKARKRFHLRSNDLLLSRQCTWF